MTEKKIHNQTKQQELNASTDGKRRRLIKSAVAIPIIMTLHSGAALARTSNLVGAVESPQAHTVEMVQGQPQVVCIKGATDLGDGQHDLEEPVVAVAELEPYITSTSQAESISLQGENCNKNGGFMVSATAWLSVGPKVGSML